jgi:hypothetical protein
MSLHVDDISGEIDVEEEVENTRKLSSSTFAKKKSFKKIDMKYHLFVKFLIISIIYCGFYIQAFVISQDTLGFEANSSSYHFRASKGSYFFNSGMADIKAAALNGTPMPSNLSKAYLEYYQEFFQDHYSTYANY